MNIRDIVAEIDAEILRLQQAKAILSGSGEKRKPGRPAGASSPSKATSFNPEEFASGHKKRRVMSAGARERIAQAQRARWVKSKKAAKKAETRKPASKPASAKTATPAERVPKPKAETKEAAAAS